MSKKNKFIELSILSVLSFLKDSIFADEHASKNGFLQSLDPRIKIVTFFIVVTRILFIKNILVLSFFYFFCLFLVIASKIDLGFFLKRTWVFMPIFSFFIAIPALFDVFTPGDPLYVLRMAGFSLVITHQGVSGASLFMMRVITSVSFIILLSITTRHFELLRVLRIFKIPQVFVMTLGMCYRYIYLFVEIIENTYVAIKSRVGIRLHYKSGQRIVAWNIASLWTRSYQMNEEVYKAMLSRGYSGESLVLEEFKISPKDWVWLLFIIGLSAILRVS